MSGLLLAGCMQDAPVKVAATWQQVEPIVAAFGYEQGIANFCGEAATGLDDFMAELAVTPGLGAVRERARGRADEVRAEFTAAGPEEAEYICTVEMFLGSEARAAEQRANWRLIIDGAS